MGHGYAGRAPFLYKSLEECIPQPASRIFQIPSILIGDCRHILTAEYESNSACSGHLRNKTCILVGLCAPQAVIEMNNE
jgi:hypothetical protein